MCPNQHLHKIELKPKKIFLKSWYPYLCRPKMKIAPLIRKGFIRQPADGSEAFPDKVGESRL
jgi:hypothetical protein